MRQGALLTISTLAEFGTIKQCNELIEAGAVVFVVNVLRADVGNCESWMAIVDLIDSSNASRQQALENRVPSLLPAGLKVGGIAELYVLCTIRKIAASEEGAKAVACAGVISAVP